MRFALTEEQQAFADALDGLLSSADTVPVTRAWAAGDHAPGRALWSRLSDLGVQGLLVPAADGGTGATPVELVIAFEALGRYAVPGPWVESAAYLPAALGREVTGIATVAVPPHTPYALDADVADEVWLAGLDTPSLVAREAYSTNDVIRSVDPTRRLFALDHTPTPDGRGGAEERGTVSRPFDLAALATAAELLGAGERVLADAVAYVQQRRQFGREIGSYQAVKHALADVRIALDFARPLAFGAALDPTPRAVSAAKVLCGDAAYLASRTGLQVHGAIGYTAEFDLSIWITRTRALVTAWGTPAFHRSRLLDSLVGV